MKFSERSYTYGFAGFSILFLLWPAGCTPGTRMLNRIFINSVYENQADDEMLYTSELIDYGNDAQTLLGNY